MSLDDTEIVEEVKEYSLFNLLAEAGGAIYLLNLILVSLFSPCINYGAKMTLLQQAYVLKCQDNIFQSEDLSKQAIRLPCCLYLRLFWTDICCCCKRAKKRS